MLHEYPSCILTNTDDSSWSLVLHFGGSRSNGCETRISDDSRTPLDHHKGLTALLPSSGAVVGGQDRTCCNSSIGHQNGALALFSEGVAAARAQATEAPSYQFSFASRQRCPELQLELGTSVESIGEFGILDLRSAILYQLGLRSILVLF